ncbi:MAG TPA: dTDP-4-dehydrorhamnose 3,5-epimerase [Candidatus Polarisedimenticolia bacterium]|nr:dTDP-4-dehydrorhamnose 3,5-epimerase [Candidatus Polarisedimenticolia bacterium]
MGATAVKTVEVLETEIAGLKMIVPRIHRDHRGFFSETYSKAGLSALGVNLEFVQDNHSLSVERGVVRGLHFQIPPFAQDKLVRVIRGSIFDVAVDLRRASQTYGKHVARVISATEWNQFLVPVGFAHGFCTLEANTEVIYKVTNYYAPEHDRGILWNDPDLGIAWPIVEGDAILSEKDRKQSRFHELQTYFE